MSLDARTKELIASLEKVVIDATDVRHFREQLDVYQDEIRDNIASMNAILEGIVSRSAHQSCGNGLNQPITYTKEQLFFLQVSLSYVGAKCFDHGTKHFECV